jgi:hypothetical protein
MRDALAGSRVTTLTGGFGELLSFAKSRSDDKVAPQAGIPALGLERGGSPSNPLDPLAAARSAKLEFRNVPCASCPAVGGVSCW